MKLKNTILAAIVAVGFAVNASAIPINLAVNDSYYLGAINDGNPPGSNELPWVNQLKGMAINTSVASIPAGETLYRSGNNFGTLNSATLGVKTDNPAKGNYVVAGTSLYLLGKYGNFTIFPATTPPSSGQISHVWYIGAISVGTELRLPGFSGANPTNNDPLSHDTIFNGTRPGDTENPRVPEGGAGVMLLGVALLSLGAFRRLLRR